MMVDWTSPFYIIRQKIFLLFLSLPGKAHYIYKLAFFRRWMSPSTFFYFSIGCNSKRKEGYLMADGVGYGGGFALLVVLFILLIIVGAAYVGGGWY
jgi:uncharacterized protein (TIGR01732 family)